MMPHLGALFEAVDGFLGSQWHKMQDTPKYCVRCFFIVPHLIILHHVHIIFDPLATLGLRGSLQLCHVGGVDCHV